MKAISKTLSKKGIVEYHVVADSHWDGFDSLVKYFIKHWGAVPFQNIDEIYSRNWVLRVDDISIAISHDSQVGNYFFRADGGTEQTLLEKIEADINQRFS